MLSLDHITPCRGIKYKQCVCIIAQIVPDFQDFKIMARTFWPIVFPPAMI